MSLDGFEVLDLQAGASLDLLALHAANPVRYPCLLETVSPASSGQGFDILFAFAEESLELGADFRLRGPDARPGAGFLEMLDDCWARLRVDRDPRAPPVFRGGWLLLLNYELRREIEPSAGLRQGPEGPVALALRCPVAVVRDRGRGRAWVVAEQAHRARLGEVARDLAALHQGQAMLPALSGQLALSMHEPAPGPFLAAVDAARAYIAAGDVFQANLSRRWTGELAPGVEPWQIHARLRRTNPAPFAGVFTFRDLALASSSPERLVRISGDRVETRPIAGTRPRLDGAGREDAQRRELLASSKERAEHVMLIDLERNDLGRICRPGSVEVSEFMTLESYAHVHHIVSNVSGVLRAGVTPGQVLRAVFPGGTITGCPKVRCMDLIDALEGVPRGPYTGSLGYLNRDGSCDLNILIRTIIVHGRQVSFAAGSGIVADSDPQRELEETRAKGRGMLLALGG